MPADQLSGFIFSQIFHPQPYVFHGGLWMILLIIFAESALLIFCFLPGDALLVIVGIFASTSDKGLGIVASSLFETHNQWADLVILWLFIIIAGIFGNFVGYWLGKKSGEIFFEKKDTFLFKKKHLIRAHNFYEDNGGMAIVLARFIPFVRTFAPFVAGMVHMDRKKFMHYNITGCMLWVGSMLLTGRLVYRFILYEFNYDLTKHLEILVLGVVAITLIIVVWKIIFTRKKIHPAA